MQRYSLALIAISAGLGLSTAAIAGEAPNSAPAATTANGAAQTATAGQGTTPRKPLRRIRRAGTSTAGANGFLPGVTFLSAVFAGTSVAATAGSAFADSTDTSNPASPE